jgi:hypothetical protein
VGVLGAVKTSLYIYIVPVVTIIAAAIILHENGYGGYAAGSRLALSGLYLSSAEPADREKSRCLRTGSACILCDTPMLFIIPPFEVFEEGAGREIFQKFLSPQYLPLPSPPRP